MTVNARTAARRGGLGTSALAPLCALVMIIAAAAPGAEQAAESSPATTLPATEWLTEADFAYSVEEAQAWRDAVLAEVERQAGRAFESVPPVRLVTRNEVHELIVDLSIVVSRSTSPDLTEAEVEAAVTVDSLLLAMGSLGWYDYKTDTLCLAAGNLVPLTEATDVSSTLHEGVMKLVIAHELAHALHHQHLGIDRQLTSLRTTHEDKAYSSAGEGFAMIVQEAVAEALGLEQANEALLQLLSLRAVEHDAARPTKVIYTEIYEPGLVFCRFHHDAGGTQRLWEILEKPPVTYAQILAPATYDDPVATRMDLDRLFSGTRAHLGDDNWGDMAMTATPDQVARPFMSVGKPVADEVQRNLKVAYSYIMSDRTAAPPRLASFACYEIADAEYGEQFTDHLAELAETQMKRLRGAAQGLTLDEYKTDPLEEVRADDSRLHRITLSPPAGAGPGPNISLAAAAAHRGTWTVQVVSSNAPLDDPAISQILTTLLDRLDSEFAIVPVEPVSTDDPLSQALSRIREHLSDGAWTEQPSEVAVSAIAQLMGDDSAGKATVEMSMQRAAGRLFECRATQQMLVALSIELRTAEAMPAVVKGLRSNLTAPLDQFKTLPGTEVEVGELSDSTIGDSISISTLNATLKIAQRGNAPIRVRLVHRDRHILYLIDSSGALEDANLEQAVFDVFSSMP